LYLVLSILRLQLIAKKERKKERKKRKKERKMRSKKVYETTKGFFDGGAEAERFALGFTIRTE